MAAPFKVDARQLMVELSVADPILKKEAERVMRETFFDPAVAELKDDFARHPVTREIAAGVDAANESGTLDATFRQKGDDSAPNLTSFLGFDETPEQVLAPILQRLDPRHPDGPKLVYLDRDRDKMAYRFEVRGPNEDALEAVTGLPWAPGISWVRRIEQGVAGIGHFLNVKGRPSSRSGGGIQIDASIRTGRFKPVSYLSQLLNNFLRRIGGLSENGRRP